VNTYQLSPLTTEELIGLGDSLFRLGLLLLKIQELNLIPEGDLVDLEALLEDVYTEVETRAREDKQFHG